AGTSPYVTRDTIDDELGVFRIDHRDGSPMALLWNFAIHGTALKESNLEYSADIMGGVSKYVEQKLGVTSLFVNGAEGDVAPDANYLEGIGHDSPIIGDKIVEIYQGIAPSAETELRVVNERVPFGNATIDFTLNRPPVSDSPIDLAGAAAALG